jgi:serine/threonine protein kinase
MSAGCVLWELYTGSPLFQGDTAAGMLQCIHKVTDLTELTLRAFRCRAITADIDLGPGGATTSLIVPGMPDSFAELLVACLRSNPGERATAAQLLSFRCSTVRTTGGFD